MRSYGASVQTSPPRVGCHVQSRNWCEECLRVAGELVALNATSADWQRNLLVSYGHVADVRLLLGDATGALESHQRALDIGSGAD